MEGYLTRFYREEFLATAQTEVARFCTWQLVGRLPEAVKEFGSDPKVGRRMRFLHMFHVDPTNAATLPLKGPRGPASRGSYRVNDKGARSLVSDPSLHVVPEVRAEILRRKRLRRPVCTHQATTNATAQCDMCNPKQLPTSFQGTCGVSDTKSLYIYIHMYIHTLSMYMCIKYIYTYIYMYIYII